MAHCDNDSTNRNYRAQFRNSLFPFKSLNPVRTDYTMENSSSPSSSPNNPYVSPIRTGLTIREVSKEIDDLRKENFNLKLRIFFMEERIGEICGPENVKNFKVNVQLQVEIADLQKEVQSLRQQLEIKDRMLDESLKTTRDKEKDLKQANLVILELQEHIDKLNEEIRKEEKFYSPIDSGSDNSAIYKEAFGLNNNSFIKKPFDPNLSTVPSKVELQKEIEALEKKLEDRINKCKLSKQKIYELEEQIIKLTLKGKKKSLAIQALMHELNVLDKQPNEKSVELLGLIENDINISEPKDTSDVASTLNLLDPKLCTMISKAEHQKEIEAMKRNIEDKINECKLSKQRIDELEKQNKELVLKGQKRNLAIQSLMHQLNKQPSKKSVGNDESASEQNAISDTEIALTVNLLDEPIEEILNDSPQVPSLRKTYDVFTQASNCPEVIHSSAQTSVSLLSLKYSDIGQSNDGNQLKEDISMLSLNIEEREKEISLLRHEKGDLATQLFEATNQKDIFAKQAQILQQHVEKIAEFLECLLNDNSFQSSFESGSDVLNQVSTYLNETLRLSQTMFQNLSVWDLSKNFPCDESIISEKGAISFSLDDRRLLSLKPKNREIDIEGRAVQSETCGECVNKTGRRRRWSFSFLHKEQSKPYIANNANNPESLGISDQESLLEITQSECSNNCMEENKFSLPKMNQFTEKGDNILKYKPRQCWNLSDKMGSFNSLKIFDRSEVRPFCEKEKLNDETTFKQFTSDSDVWSEPDRNVSVQRIGLESQSYMISPTIKRKSREKTGKENLSSCSSKSHCDSRLRRKRSGSQNRVNISLEQRLSAVESQQSQLNTLQKMLENVSEHLAKLTGNASIDNAGSVEFSSEIVDLKTVLDKVINEVQVLKEAVNDSVLKQDTGIIQEFKETMDKILKSVQSEEDTKTSPHYAKNIAKEALTELDTFKEQLLSVASSLLSNDSLEHMTSHKSSEELMANITHLELAVSNEKAQNAKLLEDISKLSEENKTLQIKVTELEEILVTENRKYSELKLIVDKEQKQVVAATLEKSPYKRISLEVEKLQSTESLYENLKTELKETEEKLKLLVDRCKEYEDDLTITNKKLDLANNKTKAQQEQINMFEDFFKRQEETIIELKNSSRGSENHIKVLENKCLKLENELNLLAHEKENLMQRNEFLNETVEVHLKKIAEMNKKHVEYESEKNNLQRMVSNLRADCVKLQENMCSIINTHCVYNGEKPSKQNLDKILEEFYSQTAHIKTVILERNIQAESDEFESLSRELPNSQVSTTNSRSDSLSQDDNMNQIINFAEESLESRKNCTPTEIMELRELNVECETLRMQLKGKENIQEQKIFIEKLQNDLQNLHDKSGLSPIILEQKNSTQTLKQEQILSHIEDLENQIKYLLKDNENLIEELKTKDLIMQEKETAIKTFSNEKENLLQKCEIMSETISNLKVRHMELQTEADNYCQQFEEFRNRISDSRSSLSLTTKKSQDNVTQLEKNLLDLRKELYDKNCLIQDKKNVISDLQSKIYDANIAVDLLKNEKSGLAQKQDELSSEITSLKHELNDKDFIIISQASEIEKILNEKLVADDNGFIKLETENKHLKEELKKKNRIIKEKELLKESIITEVNKYFKELNLHIDTLKYEANEEQGNVVMELKENLNENAKESLHVPPFKRQIEIFKQKFKHLERNLHNKAHKIGEQEVLIANLKKDNNDLKGEYNFLSNEIIKKDDHIKMLQIEMNILKDLQSENAVIKNNEISLSHVEKEDDKEIILLHLQSEKDNLIKRCSAYQITVGDLESQIEEIKNNLENKNIIIQEQFDIITGLERENMKEGIKIDALSHFSNLQNIIEDFNFKIRNIQRELQTKDCKIHEQENIILNLEDLQMLTEALYKELHSNYEFIQNQLKGIVECKSVMTQTDDFEISDTETLQELNNKKYKSEKQNTVILNLEKKNNDIKNENNLLCSQATNLEILNQNLKNQVEILRKELEDRLFKMNEQNITLINFRKEIDIVKNKFKEENEFLVEEIKILKNESKNLFMENNNKELEVKKLKEQIFELEANGNIKKMEEINYLKLCLDKANDNNMIEKYAKLNDDIATMQMNLEMQTKSLDFERGKNAELQSEINKSNERIQNMEKEINNLTSKLVKSSNKIKNINKNYSDLEKQKKLLDTKFMELEKEYENRNTEMRNMCEKCQELIETIEKLKVNCEHHAKLLNSEIQKNEILQLEHNEKNVENQNLKEEIGKMELNSFDSNNKVKRLSESNEILRGTIAKLKDVDNKIKLLDSEKQINLKMQKELREKNEEIKKLNEENISLKMSMFQFDMTKEYTKTIKDLQVNMDSIADLLNVEREKSQKLHEELITKEEEIQKLNEDVTHWRLNYIKLHNDIEDNDKKYQMLFENFQSLQTDFKDKEVTLNLENKKTVELTELLSIKNSEIQKIKKDYSDLNVIAKISQDENEKKSHVKSKCLQELEWLKLKITNLETIIHNYKQKLINDEEKFLAETNKYKTILNQKSEELETQKNFYDSELNSIKQKDKETIGKLENENTTLLVELKEKEQEIHDLQNIIQDLLDNNETNKDNPLLSKVKQIVNSSTFNPQNTDINIFNQLRNRKWILQRSILKLQKELCDGHSGIVEKQIIFCDRICNAHSAIQSMSNLKYCNDSHFQEFSVTDSYLPQLIHDCFLNLNLDIEFLYGIKILSKYLISPLIKDIKSSDHKFSKLFGKLSNKVCEKFDVENWDSILNVRNVKHKKEAHFSVPNCSKCKDDIRSGKQIVDSVNESSSPSQEKRTSHSKNTVIPVPDVDPQLKMPSTSTAKGTLDYCKNNIYFGNTKLKLTRSESSSSIYLEQKSEKKHPKAKYILQGIEYGSKNYSDHEELRQTQRSNYSSPDLGIYSDPNQEPLQILKTSHYDANIETNVPYAITHLKDFELLKKEVEECIVVIKNIESRAKSSLKLLVKDGTPYKSVESNALKAISDCCTNGNVCLSRSQQLFDKFTFSYCPVSEQNFNLLRQKYQQLEIDYRNLQIEKKGQIAKFENAMIRLKAHEKKKEDTDKHLFKQLVKTKKVLQKVKNDVLGINS